MCGSDTAASGHVIESPGHAIRAVEVPGQSNVVHRDNDGHGVEMMCEVAVRPDSPQAAHCIDMDHADPPPEVSRESPGTCHGVPRNGPALPMTEGGPEKDSDVLGSLGSAIDERLIDDEADAGDPACWVHLVCFECGQLGGHLPDCSSGANAAEAQAALGIKP